MAKVFIEESNLTAIGEAIRSKTGKTELLSPASMASEITSITTGGGGSSAPAKGFVVKRWNEDLGLAIEVETVGWTGKLPDNYFRDTYWISSASTDDTTFTINEGVTDLGTALLSGSQYVKHVVLPDTLTSLGSEPFNNARALKSVSPIPAAVTKIPAMCFYICMNLPEVTVLGNITDIYLYAFYTTTSLKKLILPNITAVPTLNSMAFTSSGIANGTGFIYVPDALVDSFKSATNWSVYAEQIKPISELEG